MYNLTFLTKSEDFSNAFDFLQTIKLYFEEAMHNNIVKPSTYLRVEQGVEILKREIDNHMQGVDKNKYYLSYKNFAEMVKSSRDVELDKNNIAVKNLINIEVSMLLKLLRAYIGKELAEKDIDSILKAIEIADKEIDKHN